MPQPTFDPGSKWLLEEQGAAILYLAGATAVRSCKAVKAEVVQPRKLPDGLLEVRLADRDEPVLVLVEVATDPEPRVAGQIADDIRLVRQTRKILPEAVVLVLRPKGNFRVPERVAAASELGWTTEALSWKVIELWTLSAEELLGVPDVGVVPWVPLARYDGPPEVLLQRCRDRIDKEGGKQRANLLAVTQVFARIKFDRPAWLDILGGTQVMIESPLIQEIVAESERAGRIKSVLRTLAGRFGEVSPSVAAALHQVKAEDPLDRLASLAGVCKDLAAFEEALAKELPAPAPPSTRGRKKPPKSAE